MTVQAAAPVRIRTGRMKRIRHSVIMWLVLTPLLVFILVPFLWAFSLSFKGTDEIFTQELQYLPRNLNFANYHEIWNSIGFSSFFGNSLFVCGLSVLVIIVLSVLCGYALSRFRFKGRKAFMLALLCTQFIPGSMLLIPLAQIYREIGLIDTHAALVITYVVFELPFQAILMQGFVSGIPFEIEEAALIDGCNRVQGIRRVVMPILTPGLVAVGIFAFVGCWNEFLFALMFVNSQSRFTIPVGLSYMRGQYGVNYGALAAGSMIALAPPIVMFAFIQKHLVQGLSSGAVKA